MGAGAIGYAWLASGVVAVLVLGGTVPGSAPESRAIAADVGTAAAPSLSIDPDAWSLTGGSTVALSATWSAASPGCAIDPYWFVWSVANSSELGTLSNGSGPSVNFTATSALSGTTTVVVRSAAGLVCGANRSGALSTARTSLTVLAPLTIQNVSLAPITVPVGGNVSIAAGVAGGLPPYAVRVDWEDGSESNATLATPGTFALRHDYGNGSYRPSITVTDSSGSSASAVPDSGSIVGDAFAVGVAPDRSATDVGVPLPWTAEVVDPPSNLSSAWSCAALSVGSSRAPGLPVDPTCTYASPGNGTIDLSVAGGRSSEGRSATATVTVDPFPSLRAGASTVRAESGAIVAIPFAVDGGVAPFVVAWNLTGTNATGAAGVPADGTFLLPVAAPRPGAFVLTVDLTDAAGAATPWTRTAVTVVPSLNESIAATGSSNATGATVAVSAAVGSGLPPFAWTVLAPPSRNPSVGGGELDAVGGFGWNGSYRQEGSIAIEVVLIDGSGTTLAVVRSVGVVPPLVAGFAVDGNAPGGGQFTLTARLSGGLPPFDIRLGASDGATWNWTVNSSGTVAWAVRPPTAGSLALFVRASDGAGAIAEWNGSVNVTAERGDSGGVVPAAPVEAVGGVAVGGVGAVAVLALRRRRRSAPPPPVDPVATVRGILEPADGAERSTVELLAEEAGVPLEHVRETLDRLIRDGQVRSESDADGTEVISWEPKPPG